MPKNRAQLRRLQKCSQIWYRAHEYIFKKHWIHGAWIQNINEQILCIVIYCVCFNTLAGRRSCVSCSSVRWIYALLVASASAVCVLSAGTWSGRVSASFTHLNFPLFSRKCGAISSYAIQLFNTCGMFRAPWVWHWPNLRAHPFAVLLMDSIEWTTIIRLNAFLVSIGSEHWPELR